MKLINKLSDITAHDLVSHWLSLFALICFLTIFASAATAQASGPLLVYETAAPGGDPSWLLVYEDGRIERDLAPYMKQAGRQVGTLDPVQLRAVHSLVKTVLNTPSTVRDEHLSTHAEADVGLVTLSVNRGGQHRSLQWRPVPGQALAAVYTQIDATLASLLYEPL